MRWSAAGVALAIAACGRLAFQHEPEPDGGLDGGVRIDAGRDAGADAARDAGIDAGTDAGTDAGPPPDFCLRVPALASAPVIDGRPEAGLAWQVLAPTGWTQPTFAIPAGQGARAAIAWRPNGIYFAVDVDDPTRNVAASTEPPYCGDSVEIYVDSNGMFASPPAYDRPGTRQCVAGAPANDTDPMVHGGLYTSQPTSARWTGSFIAAPRAGGYVAEGMIGAAELGLATWTLARGGRIGFDVAINLDLPGAPVDSSCTIPIGQFFLRVTTGASCQPYPFCNVAAFCTPVLE